MDCRNETFDYKAPPTSLPDLIDDPGLPAGSVTERICRTSQGPVQYRGDGVAYARKYAVWNRELETFTGLTELMDSGNVADIDEAMRHVTWNENVMAADAGPHRLLAPGPPSAQGEALGRAPALPRQRRGGVARPPPPLRTPHVVNPKRNWLANWNNLPSVGWTNGDGPARERENGNFHRIRLIQSLVRKVAKHPSYARSRAIELTSGTTAQQFPFVDKRKSQKG